MRAQSAGQSGLQRSERGMLSYARMVWTPLASDFTLALEVPKVVTLPTRRPILVLISLEFSSLQYKAGCYGHREDVQVLSCC